MVGELANCGEELRTSSPLRSEEKMAAVTAENELLGAASSIEANSHKLALLRPRQVQVNTKINKVYQSLT